MAQFGSAVNSAHIDAQLIPSQTGVIGTLGTSDISGTALTLPFSVDPTTGAAYVNVIQGSINVGTVTTEQTLASGTLNTLGTVGVLNTGTINALASGTISIGTVTGVDANAAAQTARPLGIGGTDAGGTIRTVNVDSTGAIKVSGASSGTNVNLITGTLNLGTVVVSGGTVQNLNAGTITALATGTITGGTLQNLNAGTVTAVGLGTVTGVTANAGSYTGNPVGVGGTDSGGTIRLALVNSSGYLTANVNSGTINVGTFTNLGTNVNIVSGSLVGTVLGGTVQNLNAGTITALATGTITGGTLQNLNAGTITSIGTVLGVGGSVITAPSATTIAIGASTSYTANLGTSIVTPKSSAGNLYMYHFYNNNSAVTYIQWFDNTAPVLGGTAPTFVLALPPQGVIDSPITIPIKFANAIKLAATTTTAGSTQAAGTVVANVFYI